MIRENLGPSAAALVLSGELTDELAEGLAASLYRLRTRYCYDQVHLEIRSMGGAMSAFDRCVEAIGEARAGGMRVDTRVRTQAASAAAFLASLGDRREAAPTARLLYHNVSAEAGAPVTAIGAVSLGAFLAGRDREVANALAARARLGGGPPRFKASELTTSDWPVVERLAGRGKRRRKQLRALRRRVAQAAGAPDDGPLAHLYAELLALDAWISARLAAELLLMDRVANPGSPEGRASSAAPDALVVPEWRTLHPDGGAVPREALCRHALVLGETGSGKTASGILPLVAAALRPDSPVGCLLVIDPKREIAEAARQAGGEFRVIDPGSAQAPRIDVMAGPLSVAEDLSAGRVQTAARGILIRAASLDPFNPARTLTGEAVSHHSPYWPQQGSELALAALALALTLSVRRVEAFGDRTRGGALRGLPARLRQACAAPLVEGGFLVEDAEVAAAADAARRRIMLGGEPAEHVAEDFERAVGRSGLYRNSPAFRDEFEEAARKCRGALRPDPDAEGFGPDPQMPLPLEMPEDYDDPHWKRLARILPPLDDEDGSAEGRSREEEARRRHNAPAVAAMAAEAVASATRCAPEGGAPAGLSMMAVAQGVLTGLFAPGKADLGAPGKADLGAHGPAGDGDPPLPACVIAERLRPALEGDEIGVALREIDEYWSTVAAGSDNQHYTSILAFAKLVFAPFAAPVPRRALLFGCEPAARGSAGGNLDFATDVAARGRRAVHVVCPSLGAKDEALYARALKATFFEAVLNCPERAGRGGAAMPLVGYFADECHRFVTSDATHGEQSFLDTCRSFGAFCALACQSVASLRHALNGGQAQEAAIDILLANTGTKLFFRSTEPDTRGRLAGLCPAPHDGPSLIDARPPSGLLPGECYAVLPDGRFERRQLAPYRSAAAPNAGPRGGERAKPGEKPPGNAGSPAVTRLKQSGSPAAKPRGTQRP